MGVEKTCQANIEQKETNNIKMHLCRDIITHDFSLSFSFAQLKKSEEQHMTTVRRLLIM